jgi:hypothetical protein
MNAKIPAELARDVPQNMWGKILMSTPVIMTVVATLLAGLSSSEMTRAQYERAYAAQLQSKAGDQWSYFQAKKLRAALAHNSLDVLHATSETTAPDAAAFGNADAGTIAALVKGELPKPVPPAFDDAIKAALTAVETSRPENEIATKLAAIKPESITEALAAARKTALDFAAALEPLNTAIEKLGAALAGTDSRSFQIYSAAHLRYNAARYDLEARLNQSIANLYELQVRQNNISAERNARRSGKFFFGMLAAQAAVIVSTFSIAAQKRTFLWALAACAVRDLRLSPRLTTSPSGSSIFRSLTLSGAFYWLSGMRIWCASRSPRQCWRRNRCSDRESSSVAGSIWDERFHGSECLITGSHENPSRCPARSR